MLLIKMSTVYYIFLNVIVKIHALVPMPLAQDNEIIITESTIRNTVNSLFKTLKVHGITSRKKIKEYSTIHNFFVSITMTDCDTLNKIARLSRVNIIDNNTSNFIAYINEVLNTDEARTEENYNNIYVAGYIQKFIQKLKHLKDAYISNKNPVINAKILQYIDNKRPLVNFTEDNINSTKSYKQFEDEELSSEDDIWRPVSRRIYQGIRTSIKKFPFMASVHFFNKFQCAGSIIKNDLVITSSSCLQISYNNRFFRENPAFLSVRVGCDYYDYCGESISVLEIHFHPQYDPKTLKHNIAIMRLNRIINFRRSHGKVKKIEVDKNPNSLPVTCSITAIGWGAKDHNNVIYDVLQNKLSYADLDLYLLKDCQDHYSKEFVTNRNFCAGFYSKGGGACKSDAGGPGICDSILVGIISFGSAACGAPSVPTVFTKVGFYYDWIENIMEQEIETKPGRTTTRRYGHTLTFKIETTTKQIKMYPLGRTTSPNPITTKKVQLRIAQEEEFKDFLSTIFESDEIEAYLEASDAETEVNIDQLVNINRSQKKHFKNVIEEYDNVVTSTDKNVLDSMSTSVLKTSGPKINREIDSSEYDKTGSEKDDKASATSTTEWQKRFTILENASNDDKSNDEEIDGSINIYGNNTTNNTVIIEKTIMDVMDKLDIDELLKSMTSSETADKNIESTKNSSTLNITSILIKNETFSIKSEHKARGSNQTFYQDVQLDENDEGEESGLSIETKPFIALRDKRDSTETQNVFSNQPSIFKFITSAIEEQIKEMNKTKHYLL